MNPWGVLRERAACQPCAAPDIGIEVAMTLDALADSSYYCSGAYTARRDL